MIAPVKLSCKGRYALQAVFDLAFHVEAQAKHSQVKAGQVTAGQVRGSAQVKDISERQQIPPRFLEQVLQDLRRAGLVNSKRGPRGGYQLARAPETIRVGDVVRAVDGPVALHQEGTEATQSTGAQVTCHVLREMTSAIDACLDATTVADMCQVADHLGLSAQPPTPYLYSI